jgi:glycosyltransferase involved in cell wall biosynthesis
VILPVYNERSSIERACREVVSALEGYRGRAVVIVVDDGSRDGSAEIVARLAGELEPLELVRHPANAGYGQALRTGAERARELHLGYVAFIDSDLTNPPSDLLAIGELASQGHAYIKASRFVPGGSIAAVPFKRRAVSQLGNVVASALFGTPVRDVTNGFRAGRTDLLCSLRTRECGFAVIMEEFDQTMRRGIEPAVFPTTLTARSADQRSTAFAYSPQQLWSYLRYPLGAFARRVARRAGLAR